MTRRHYLDHAATSPLRPSALAAMQEALAVDGNPSSVHLEGRQARRIIEDARANILEKLGRPGDRLIFTSGATEANAAVLAQCGGAALCSAIEHPSVLAQPNVQKIAAGSDGRIDLAALKAAVQDTAFVSVMAVNNETGVVQPLADVAAIVRAAGGRLHVDAVQALGRLDLAAIDADYLTISAHKIGGPKGVGAVLMKADLYWQPWLLGGGQEQRLRSGTENIAGIAGFAAALDDLDHEESQRIETLRLAFERQLLAARPDLDVIGGPSIRAPHITAIAFPGKRAETLVMQCDLAGVAVSAGSACSSGKVQASHVLAAMGLSEEVQLGTIRISLGWNSVADDLTPLLELFSSNQASPV